jgi:hypothetical protein
VQLLLLPVKLLLLVELLLLV